MHLRADDFDADAALLRQQADPPDRSRQVGLEFVSPVGRNVGTDQESLAPDMISAQDSRPVEGELGGQGQAVVSDENAPLGVHDAQAGAERLKSRTVGCGSGQDDFGSQKTRPGRQLDAQRLTETRPGKQDQRLGAVFGVGPGARG